MKVIERAQELPGGGGFVPTMGALHEGHAALIRRSAGENERTVVSIFVNPTQFGPSEDFSKYPRTLEADLEVARAAGASHVYVPSVEAIYAPGHSTFIEVQGVSEPWCGNFRPGHFRGVATVVQRLFQLVQPERAYFGQKDLQQCLVIGRMAKDLGLPVKLVAVPTVREADGLAMSSRNRYLGPEEREKATVIFRALEAARLAYVAGERDVAGLYAKVDAVFAMEPAFRVQYRDLRSLPNLGVIQQVTGPAALAVAGFLGATRLIDNLLFEPM